MARKSTGGRAPRQALASQAAFEEQPVRLVVWADWVVAALTAGGDAALAAVQQLQQTAAEGGPAPVVVLEVENFGTGGASQLGLWGKYTLATLAVALGQEAAAEQLMEAAAAAAAQLQVESEGSAAESGDEGSSGSEGSSGDGSSSSDGGSWLYAAAWALPLGRQGGAEELSEEEGDEEPYGTPWDLLEGPMDQLVKGEDGACLWQVVVTLLQLAVSQGMAGAVRALAQALGAHRLRNPRAYEPYALEPGKHSKHSISLYEGARHRDVWLALEPHLGLARLPRSAAYDAALRGLLLLERRGPRGCGRDVLTCIARMLRCPCAFDLLPRGRPCPACLVYSG